MAAKTRLRKVNCPDCGYTVRMTRSWMLQGFPQCPCGGTMQAAEPSDLAYLGLIGPDDMPRPLWTAICHENGWEDAIIRTTPGKLRMGREPAYKQRQAARADHCAYPGCGRWVKHSETHCPNHSDELAEAIPF